MQDAKGKIINIVFFLLYRKLYLLWHNKLCNYKLHVCSCLIYQAFLFIFMSILITGCGIYRDDPVKNYNEFGLKCAKMGLWSEAIMRWERIIKANPDNAQVRNNLAVAYESKGELKSAKTEYEKAIELDPNNKTYKKNYIKFKRNNDRAIKIQNVRDKMRDLEEKEQEIKDNIQDKNFEY